jgi:predicted RNase H-like HicB family nuclease
MEKQELHVDVHREDGSYWAQVRELPGCFASGVTAAELIESAEEAVALYSAPSHRDRAGVAVQLTAFDLSIKPDRPLDRA